MRTRISFILVCLALFSTLSALPQTPPSSSHIQSGQSYKNDVSPALRDFPIAWPPRGEKDGNEREANLNPKVPHPFHLDAPDPVVDRGAFLRSLIPDVMPSPILNFD